MNLQVLQLNLWHGAHVDAAMDYFRRCNADVLLLQEVTSGTSSSISHGVSDCLERIVSGLGYHYSYAPGWRLTSQGHRYLLGNAIVSRIPFVSTASQFYYKEIANCNLEELQGDAYFPCVLVSARLNLAGVGITVATTHFLWSLHPETTTGQMEAVDSFLPLIEREDNLILSGDFNLTKESPVYKKLTSKLIDDMPSHIDNTLDRKLHKLEGSKSIAVDYMFHKGPDIKLTSIDMSESGVSDHLPILATYQIGKS